VNTEGRPHISLAEFLSALSFVSDTGMGQSLEHGLKTAYIGVMLAGAAGLSAEDRAGVYYGALLKDAGCTACGTVFATFFDGDDLGPRSDALLLRPDSTRDAIAWFWRHASTDPALPVRIGRLFSFMTQCRATMKEGVTAHCEVGEMFARRLALPATVQQAIRFSWERWDGKGLGYGHRGAQTPVAARVLHLAQVAEAAYAFGGASAARAIVAERKGADFDPDLVGPFLELSARPGFWDLPDSDSVQEQVLAMKPPCSFDSLPASELDSACEVLADLADVKSRSTWNHSLLVAETTVAIAERLGLSAAEVKRLRRAALVHDLGKAAVPVGILEKTEPLSVEEWERFRLHPYYTERALSRVGPLRDLAADAAAHHEWLDGSGYYRQLTGDQIPLGGRILAVADSFTILSQTEGPSDPERALKAMKPLVASEFDPDCYEALVAAKGGKTAARPLRARVAGNLTDREIEVLRLVCSGRTNREIASALVLSGKTVEHHLEHVYNKLGVSSRTAASVFAVQNGLAP
jgi:HD-GYP domain-containing protein (c-di-GMP phosphodiesterase class II)